jgi:tetratricopeptide (TPR) repeat protein
MAAQAMTQGEAERLLALAREVKLSGPESSAWVERLKPLREQLLEAVRFLANAGREEEACELAANVWRVWRVSGDIVGGRQLLGAALDVGGSQPSRARALALYGDGLLAFRANAMADSLARNEAALETARAIHDREAEALALVGLSRVALRDGDFGRVRRLATRARKIVATLDAATDVAPLHLLAVGHRLAGSYDEAFRLYRESLELNRRLGDARMVAIELHNLGHVELHRGHVNEAERCFAECVSLRNQEDPYEAAMTHLNDAALAFAHVDRERAKEVLQNSRSTLEQAGIALDPDDAFEVRWLQDQLL